MFYYLLGMITWGLVYPIDVIKTKIQGDLSDDTKKQKEILKGFINDKGFSSLYRGMSTCLVIAFFVNCVFFYVDEFFSNYLKKLNLNYNKNEI